ncbi:Glycine dehydrogenase (decarboxylating) [Alkaliphilus metalliredigens QYMF]|uniref:Probable glycine dehydrogenase (decarboxylating) subunit 2 n=1 Tax=Alkaliphilus metalliredigens (strain QYMF) TaxID=293826 RepID=A6TMY9_ALKMQ|nr:aminomethyl-transferring glycine dehydrogenase subunit GcvPB [Alkaliphilus metalliredigens]ABR47557.1 Glycine dehydrogenase (decarboxylating) [Alkaliphilus metalliredigens QYMF]
MKKYNQLSFELSKPGRIAYQLPACDVPEVNLSEILPAEMIRDQDVELPELSQGDVMRHYTLLSNKNFGVDTGFYPLGSCTMKYNPKVNEDIARLAGFSHIHPYQPEETVQGALALTYELDQMLSEITGMERVTLQPVAGSHGEMTGLMIIKAYHESRGDHKRKKIICPDSAHGTNPASAAVAGFDIIEVKSNDQGEVDVESLKAVLSDEVAGLMLTNPNTLGLFETNIKEMAQLVHEAGGLLYYDGANTNAIMGKTRPGDMGFDVVHLNLHKTFATPHGGGGPGSGPVGVRKDLVPFLPTPVVEKKEDRYILDYDRPQSIGKVSTFYGNFGVTVKAFAYILSMGGDGLKKASEMAVLNANYLMHLLKDHYEVAVNRVCKHEFVLAGLKKEIAEMSTLNIAKRLLDYGYHPPTVYFPLIVREAMMFEPTETESKETLDQFADALIKIAQEAKDNPELVSSAPQHTSVGRLDEAKAARSPVVKWQRSQ